MKSLFAVALAIFIVGTPHEGAAQNLSLKAGAAKVDVTPADTALPRNYEGILGAPVGLYNISGFIT